jgi:hypothetical protein
MAEEISMNQPAYIRCPFVPCQGEPRILIERGEPGKARTHRIEQHVVGGASWFGVCPASLQPLPLSPEIREYMREQATVLDRMIAEAEAERPGREDPPEQPHIAPTYQRSSWIRGNRAPQGPVFNRPWEKLTCSKCDKPVGRVKSGDSFIYVHLNDFKPADGHPATPHRMS